MKARHVLVFAGLVPALTLAFVLATAQPAAAHHCQDFSDCFATADAASDALLGLTFLGMLSMALDFIPYVGTAKGVVEAATGRDILTGQELTATERLLGLIPGRIGRAGDLRSGARLGPPRPPRGPTPPHRPPRGSVPRAPGLPSRDIPLIGGRRPINSAYAGRVYDGPAWTPELANKYPDGVRFTESGFPDFSPYSRAQVQSGDLTGVYKIDEAAANRSMGWPRTPQGYVWHHVEDGRTLMLVPKDLHGAVRHTGGSAVIRGGS
jgi:hypothetical protein